MAVKVREHWGSRIGAVLAAAGNAVGLGNLLRFPSKVALYGGGAFIVPYLISLALFGLPLMWVEWMAGRYGGIRGHGSTVGIMGAITRGNVWARLLGIFGVAAPVLIVFYYIYIESWTLGFALYSLFGKMPTPVATTETTEALKPFAEFLKNYTAPSLEAYIIFWITFILNWIVLHRGVRRGIELVAKVGMPALFLMGIILMVVIFTSSGHNPEWSAVKGLEYIWKPDFSRIFDGKVWVEAAGQIFFTLSLGMGAIAVYASYVKEDEDIVLSGLATASTNEFVEVIMGSAIAIPAAFLFFGPESIEELAEAGTFRLGFMSMPAVLTSLPLGFFWSFLWFMLLFIAAFTSSIALIQPLIAFLEDELNISHRKAVAISMITVLIGAHLSIFMPGYIDELDFWAGSFMLLFFGILEIIFFVWLFGPNNFIEELNKGASIKVPKWVAYITGTVSLAFLIFILVIWLTQNLSAVINQKGTGIWLARITIIVFLLILSALIVVSTRRNGD
ncbi:MAG: sodium-dependent transporter [candidate division WOR-3 bacterium]